MNKRLYLLEWKLCQTRAWVGWMVFWMVISFLMLSAMMMTGHLLDKVVLPPAWLAIWCSPWFGFLLKVRATEQDKVLVHSLHFGGLSVYRWTRQVAPGNWSVDVVNGRYRLNRIATVGNIVHYPWRLNYLPLFLTPDNRTTDIEGSKYDG
ncbi:hypothetical protein QPK13_22760 [Photorhabdus tasmaniensis]